MWVVRCFTTLQPEELVLGLFKKYKKWKDLGRKLLWQLPQGQSHLVGGLIVIHLFTSFIPGLSPQRRLKVAYIILVSSVLSSQWLCKVGLAENAWLTQRHPASFNGYWAFKPSSWVVAKQRQDGVVSPLLVFLLKEHNDIRASITVFIQFLHPRPSAAAIPASAGPLGLFHYYFK